MELQAPLVSLDVDLPIWERVFTVAPLVVVGTKGPDGGHTFAPKHQAMPIGWANYFGFACRPEHRTYRNVLREGVFTVTYPLAGQVVHAALAALIRHDDDARRGLDTLPTFPAEKIDGVFLNDGYLFLECELEKIVGGFGPFGLITGQVAAAYVREDALRIFDQSDHELIGRMPLPVYLAPGRYGSVWESFAFPMPEGMRHG
ncbi:flavin reductase [Rhodocaloribacter sp.]